MNLRAFRNSSFHPEQHANDSQIFAKSQLCSFFVLSINHQTKSNRMMDFSFKELFLVLLVVQIEKTWEFSEAKSFLEFVFFIRRTNSRMDPVKNWNLSTALERKIDIDAAHSACQKFASWRWIIYFGPEIDKKKANMWAIHHLMKTHTHAGASRMPLLMLAKLKFWNISTQPYLPFIMFPWIKKRWKRGNGRGGVRYWLIWKQHWWRIHRLWGERNEFNNPFFVCSSMPFQYLQSLCVSATMRTWKARILSYLEYEFSASFKVDWKKNDSANVPQHTKIDLSPITVFFPSQYFSANVF